MSDKKIGCVGHDCAECAGAMTEWQSLTDEEISAAEMGTTETLANGSEIWHIDLFARAIEAALKEKNT